MRRSRRDLLLPALAGAAGAFVLAWMGLLTVAFTDYELEAEPALGHLRGGDVAGFLAHAPAYGGSLILRAPFALLPGLWDGGALAVFRAMAAPCLAAGVVLGVVLWDRARTLGRTPPAAWLALGLCAVNPLTLRALELGHPEELLVGVLCVGAALAARADKPLAAGLMVGLAAGAKPWAVVAIVPVLVALPARRLRAAAAALAGGALLGAPVLLAAHGAPLSSAARASGVIFQPWQAWWFFGAHGHVVMGVYGPHPGYRAAPAWISPVAHPLVVAATLAVTLAWAWRTRGAGARDGLLALALVLLLRCLLDPWNTSYYAVPFLLALTAWEVHARRGLPWLSLVATALAWWTLVELPAHATPDTQAFAYLAWALPLALALGVRLLAPASWNRLAAPLAVLAERHLPTLTAGRTA